MGPIRIDDGRNDDARSTGTKPRARSSTDRIIFGAVGSPMDGKAFVTVIRAFALAGRLGDSLLLQGCGGRRSRLGKWARALRVDRSVTFVEGDDRDATISENAIVLLSITSSRKSAAWWTSRESIIRVTAVDGMAPGGDAVLPHVEVRAGDVLGLCNAMHVTVAAIRARIAAISAPLS